MANKAETKLTTANMFKQTRNRTTKKKVYIMNTKKD